MAEAEGVLREARAGAEALGHRRVLREILRELGRIVLEITDTIDDERRAKFLTRP